MNPDAPVTAIVSGFSAIDGCIDEARLLGPFSAIAARTHKETNSKLKMIEIDITVNSQVNKSWNFAPLDPEP